MGASGGIMMGASMGAQGVGSIGNAYAQSQALRAQGAYRARIAQTNADLAEIRSEDAINEGNHAASINDMKTARTVGAQRARLAAQGIDVNTGSAAEVQEDTAAIGALDSLTIRNNAWKRSWGYRVEGMNATYSGKFSGMAADYGADNTLLTGGMTALSDFTRGGYYLSQNRGGGKGSGGSSGGWAGSDAGNDFTA